MSKRFYDDYESDAIEIWGTIEALQNTCEVLMTKVAKLMIRCAKLESENK